MTLGLIQFQPMLAQVAENIARLKVLLSKTQEASLVVLPELANSGYNFKTREQAWQVSEEIGKSKFLDFLEATAQKNNQFIVSGLNERIGSQLFNTSVLVGPKGYIGKYQKIHLYQNEKDIFELGATGLPVFDIGFCKMGMLICYDYWFPEVWRILSLKGADLICHPSNLLTPGMALSVMPIHAMLNKVYIATANRIGEEGDISFCGLSVIASPKGEVLFEASRWEEEVHVTAIDLSQTKDKFLNPRNHIYQDRQINQYAELLDHSLHHQHKIN